MAISYLPGGSCPRSIPDHTPLYIEEIGEIQEILKQVLDTLPQDPKLVFVLHAIEELSYEEIASMLDQSLSHIRQLYRSARERLRRWLVAIYRERAECSSACECGTRSESCFAPRSWPPSIHPQRLSAHGHRAHSELSINELDDPMALESDHKRIFPQLDAFLDLDISVRDAAPVASHVWLCDICWQHLVELRGVEQIFKLLNDYSGWWFEQFKPPTTNEFVY